MNGASHQPPVATNVEKPQTWKKKQLFLEQIFPNKQLQLINMAVNYCQFITYFCQIHVCI